MISMMSKEGVRIESRTRFESSGVSMNTSESRLNNILRRQHPIGIAGSLTTLQSVVKRQDREIASTLSIKRISHLRFELDSSSIRARFVTLRGRFEHSYHEYQTVSTAANNRAVRGDYDVTQCTTLARCEPYRPDLKAILRLLCRIDLISCRIVLESNSNRNRIAIVIQALD